jgi:hypothetical protein
VRKCPSCGYCASDISKPVDGIREIIYSKEYQAKLYESRLPKLTNRFHCQSILCEQSQDWSAAGWACLHAAWVCDDEQYESGSQAFRIKAAILFRKAMKSSQDFAKYCDGQYIILVDILRRVDLLKAAHMYCKIGLQESQGTTENEILKFEEHLILKGDTLGYCVEDVNIPTFDVRTSQIDDALLAERARRFPNIKNLNLMSTQVTDDGLVVLSGLPFLEELDLSYTNITDKGLKHFTRLQNLNTLFLMKYPLHNRWLSGSGIGARQCSFPYPIG